MARKIKVVAQAALVGTDGDDVLIGSNREDQPADVLDGGAGNDYFESFQGADSLTGGTGSDVFHFTSWASSNKNHPYSVGMDTIQDFKGSEGDKIDVSAMKHYFDSDGDGVVDTARPIQWSDVSFNGNEMNISVWEGDNTWDLTVVVLGETPTEGDMIF